MKTKRNLLGKGLAGIFLALCLCFLCFPAKTEAAVKNNNLQLNNVWHTGVATSEDSIHYYHFTLPTDGYLEAGLTVFGQVEWSLLDENLQKQDWGWGYGCNGSVSEPSHKVDGRWLNRGSYTIKIEKDGWDNGGEFWLKGTFRPANNGEREPNQIYTQAHALNFNSQIRGAFTEQDWHDYYKIVVPKSQTIAIQIQSFCNDIDVVVRNTDMDIKEDYTIWGGSETDPELTVKQVALTPGTYYVHLSQDGWDGRGYYDLKIGTAVVKSESVRLNRTWGNLTAGDAMQLTATVSPDTTTNKQVRWRSSNTRVARVDANGRVTAVGAGEATITAEAADGSGAYATCRVEVKGKPIKKTLKVSASKVSLYKGEKKSIKATTTPKAKISYSSSNTRVAKVNSKGKITAVGKGKCTIYVRANGLKKKVSVTVKNPVLKIKDDSIKLKKGKSATIECTVKPKAKITYRSSNKKIAKVSSSGKIKARRKGSCVIYVTANGKTETVKVKVK